MDAAPHVLDLHMAEPGRGGADAVGGRLRFQALAVADVEREPEGGRVAERRAEPVEAGEIGQQMARLGFDGERNARGRGGVQHRPEGVGQPLPRGVLVRAPAAAPR